MKKGQKITEEMRETMRKAQSNRSDLVKKHISEAKSGKKNPMFGRTGLKSPRYGKQVKKEVRLKISKSLMGHKQPPCSEETRKKISKAKTGKKTGRHSWNWIEDRSKIKTSDDRRDDANAIQWRKEVYKRDNWKCKINNKDCKGKIEAHHICSWKEFPELRYDINNGITLCHHHHPRGKKQKEIAENLKKLI